ncbi:phosphatidylinositol 4-kinase [Babesia ovis]|uniref:1-phosphatidylinositol 4-kinase n=1 Tax=Babesia ovis TaxID=5869 RepID=A0A9W5TA86_BABOV|nr:phosphatidylinositol 4-kinase [Babesia ovis]
MANHVVIKGAHDGEQFDSAVPVTDRDEHPTAVYTSGSDTAEHEEDEGLILDAGYGNVEVDGVIPTDASCQSLETESVSQDVTVDHGMSFQEESECNYPVSDEEIVGDVDGHQGVSDPSHAVTSDVDDHSHHDEDLHDGVAAESDHDVYPYSPHKELLEHRDLQDQPGSVAGEVESNDAESIPEPTYPESDHEEYTESHHSDEVTGKYITEEDVPTADRSDTENSPMDTGEVVHYSGGSENDISSNDSEEAQSSDVISDSQSDAGTDRSNIPVRTDSSYSNDFSTQLSSKSTDSMDTNKSMITSMHSDDYSSAGGLEPKKLFNISRKSSKKRLDKQPLGTSENPLDITDLLVDSGSLLQLYQNDYFDAYMHMHHLYHRKETGVHEYLVNLLYSKRTDQEVMFYLPQLCQLSISKYGKSSLHRFLLDRASTSMHFALKLSWFYQAIIHDQASKIGHLAQKMTQETEMAVVNCKLISPLSPSVEPTEDRELNLCSKGLLVRRTTIMAIRAGHDGDFNRCTDMDALQPPTIPDKMVYNATTLLCPISKTKVPTPYAKIGSPLDLETQPYVDCPDEIQYELERLMMKQRRLDYFNMLSNFVRLCMEVSKLLTTVPKRDARSPLLTLFAKSLNEWMLVQRCVVAAYEESFAYRCLSLPMRKMGKDKRTNIPFQFLRIVENEIKIFLSKKRAPFVFYIEIANLDEDIRNISRGGNGKPIENVTFRDLYVYEAIVKDLVATGILDIADVSCIRNPLECIRYVMGMLPQETVDRYNERRRLIQDGEADSWDDNSDESVSALLSAIHGQVIGSNNKSSANKQDTPSNNKTQSAVETRFPILERMTPQEAKAVVFPELFEDKKKQLRKYSPYGNLETWNVRAVIIKGGDDLRQEYMVNQLLILFNEIFSNAHLPLWLRPIEILVTGPNCGIIEFLHDTCSVDVVKRKFNVDSIARAFERMYADRLYEARKNFIESHAAYSIISYLLQVRDRHNGNILLDSEGHVIHIDYGFCLSNTPGNISFETSPFKLTKEYVDVMGGEFSDNFGYFKALVIRGLLEARKHMDRIVLLVEMMTDAHKMPCFAAGTTYTMDMLRERFMLNLSEDVCIDRIVAMIDESLNNFTTVQYDNFQRLTNGIK